jgi:hypothetical protein
VSMVRSFWLRVSRISWRMMLNIAGAHLIL